MIKYKFTQHENLKMIEVLCPRCNRWSDRPWSSIIAYRDSDNCIAICCDNSQCGNYAIIKYTDLIKEIEKHTNPLDKY